MGFIDSFERRLEALVTGTFSKAFKSQLQPVEIAAAIRAELDKSAAVVTRERILAANKFVVRLSPTDLGRLQVLGATLSQELDQLVTKHVKKQRYQLAGPLEINLSADPTLLLGQIRVDAQSVQGRINWVPALDFGGKRYLLAKSSTTVGRDASSDIVVADTGLSRQHFVIRWNGSAGQLEDLGSTNGTKVAGARITKSVDLIDGLAIEAGRTQFVFRVIANSEGDA